MCVLVTSVISKSVNLAKNLNQRKKFQFSEFRFINSIANSFKTIQCHRLNQFFIIYFIFACRTNATTTIFHTIKTKFKSDNNNSKDPKDPNNVFSVWFGLVIPLTFPIFFIALTDKTSIHVQCISYLCQQFC